MSTHLEIQTNGRCLRVILPDVVSDWEAVSLAVAFGLEEQVDRAEISAPCYEDDVSLDAVRRLVAGFEQRGIDAIVEWQGLPERELVTVGRRP